MNYFNLPFGAASFFISSLCLVSALGYLDHQAQGDQQRLSMFYAFGWGAGFTVSTMLYYLAVVSLANPSV